MPRLQSIGADETMLRLALVLIMTCRGIPCLYYGSEQGLHDDTNGGDDPYNRPMMVAFDGEAPLYQAVRKLAHVRKNNISVQFGSSWTKYLTPDVFCFSRRYRDSRCFVALNRGDTVALDKVLTDLPDATYTCALSGRDITIAGGEANGLELAPGEALVLSFEGSPSRGDAVTVFQVNGCPTTPGDMVAVIGNCPELGEWDVARAVPLEYINSGTWQAGLAFERTAGKQVTYKYMIVREDAGLGSPRRENRTTRRRVVPETGTAKWRDIWEE
jgi:cyclomaltodextrin glucanotransferase